MELKIKINYSEEDKRYLASFEHQPFLTADGETEAEALYEFGLLIIALSDSELDDVLKAVEERQK